MKSKYQICTKCIMDTSDPEIIFDENGVCNHCSNFENILRKRWFPNKKGKEILDNYISQIKHDGIGHDYDCIIGLSGGLDSSYLAYILKNEYPDLRILAVHVDGGWNSELAVHNIENIVKKLNIDLYTSVINWEEMKNLQLSYFKSQLANQDVPQDHAFFATLYDIADKHKIKYFLSGGNIATESILPTAWGYMASDGKQLRAIHKVYGTVKLKDYKTFSFFKRKFYYPFINGFEVTRPLDFLVYIKDDAKRIITEKLDWKDYGGKHHESRFTKFFQAYYLPKKFGFDKRRGHLSSLIVSDQISREEALLEIQKPSYDLNELDEDKEFISKKLGVSVQEFDEIMKMPNKIYQDYPSEYMMDKIVNKSFKVIKKLLSKD